MLLAVLSEAHDKIVVFVAEDRVLALQPTAERVEMFDLQMIDDQLPLIRTVAAREVEHKTTGKIWASETHRSIFFRLRTDSFSLDLTEEEKWILTENLTSFKIHVWVLDTKC